MKKLLLAGVAAAVLYGVPANAQMFNWTGFYVGANAGWQSSDFKGTFPVAPGFNFIPGSSDQTVAGVYGGYQFQNGNWVIGAETGFDVPISHKYASSPGTNGPGSNCGYNAPSACEARTDSIFRIGARLGWAFDRWLVYGTGGYARGQVQLRAQTLGIIADTASYYSDGWYAGGGIDFAVFKNLFLGVEYKHYDLGSSQTVGTINVRNVSTTADSVVGRMTIKFGN